MDAFIQFRVAADGSLSIVIHKLLWDELHKSDANPETEGDFVRVALTKLTGANLRGVTAIPGSEEWPCRPTFQLVLET